MIVDERALRSALLPLLAALLLLASACSSSGGEEGTDSGVDSDESNDVEASSGSEGTGTLCGPMRFEESEIAEASGRVNDSAMEAFSRVGLPLLAPEQWSVVRETENQVAVADSTPLSEEGSSYWVRIVDGGLVAFDGVCDFAESGDTAAPPGPETCSVQADGFAITTVWSGADPSAPVAVLRDGIEIHVFAATVMSTEAGELLDARKAEHGEPVTDSTTPGPEAGQGGFADLAAEPNEAHTYSVQSVGADGSRSDPLDCGQATLDAAATEITCSLTTDDFGWPVIRWEAGTPVRVVILRNGEALEPDAVTFSSPYTDRSAPGGQDLSYELDVPGGDTLPCGTTSIDDLPTGSSDLQAAATDNASSNQGPYQYVTLEPICATCEGLTVELYLVPNPNSPTQHVVETVWVDGTEKAFPGPWLIDPLAVANLLLQAESDEKPMAYAIDPATGIIEQWTIDGEGAIVVCLEVDTRPIDMRDSRCGPSNLLS